MRRAIPLLAAATAIALGGCGGGEESSGPEIVPAAGENTPMGTPGVPAGAAYDLSAAEWLDLGEAGRLSAAEEFVDDHPDECRGSPEPVPAEQVSDYAAATAGADYPLNAPVAELLAEGCAASLQSAPTGDGG